MLIIPVASTGHVRISLIRFFHQGLKHPCESIAISILRSGRKVDFSSLLPETVGMGFAHC